MSKRFAVSLIILVAELGVTLRAWGINRHLLWQDEAESGIYALQILEAGYPNAEFHGERLYENRSFIESASPKYEYESTNFYGSKFEKNKGWLPHYVIAASFKIFGVGTWPARLPAVVISGLTIFIAYFLARQFLGKPWALAVAAFYAINPIAIYYEQQARYYSFEILLISLCLLVYFNFRRAHRRGWLAALTACLGLLFHTHAVAAVLVGIFFLAHWLGTVGWRAVRRQPMLGWCAAFGLAATVPWMIAVNYFSIFRYQGLEPYLRIIWLVVLVVVGVVVWGIQRFARTVFHHPITFGLGSQPAAKFIATFCVGYTALAPLLLPVESVAEKQFVPLLPLLTVVVVYLFSRLWVAGVSRRDSIAGLLVFGVFGGAVFAALHVDTLDRSVLYASDWVAPVLQRLRIDPRVENGLILTDYYQFPLSFYGRVPVQLLYVLRCSYLESFPYAIRYVVHPVVVPMRSSGPPLHALPYCYRREQDTCRDRLAMLRSCLQTHRECQLQTIDAGTEVLACSPLRRYE